MRERGAFLTIAAVLFGLLGVSNLLKPFQIGGAETGFVFFGQRLAGMANTIIGPLFGLTLLAYAIGIWGLRRWALPLHGPTPDTSSLTVSCSLCGTSAPSPPTGGSSGSSTLPSRSASRGARRSCSAAAPTSSPDGR